MSTGSDRDDGPRDRRGRQDRPRRHARPRRRAASPCALPCARRAGPRERMPLGPGRSRSLTSRPGSGSTRPLDRRRRRLPPGAQRAPRRGRHRRAGRRRGRAGRPGPLRLPLGAAPRRRLDAAPSRARREAEEVVRAPPAGVTVLRPAAYHQNLARRGARRAGSPCRYSLDAPFTNVDLGDVAEVAATVLTRARARGRDLRPRRARGALGARPGARRRRDVLGRPVQAVRVDARGVGRRARSGARRRQARRRPAGDVRGPTTAAASWAVGLALLGLLGHLPTDVGRGCGGCSKHAVTHP